MSAEQPGIGGACRGVCVTGKLPEFDLADLALTHDDGMNLLSGTASLTSTDGLTGLTGVKGAASRRMSRC